MSVFKKIAIADLDKLFAKTSEKMSIYVPTDNKDGDAVYTEWKDGVKLSDAVNTLRSAKDFFFPQTENLAGFKLVGKTIEMYRTAEEKEDFVLFGVRACDVKSFAILDSVFLADPVDTFYAARREHGIVDALACNDANDTCFCKTFGIDPAEPGADVSAWKNADEMFFKANTDKGAAWLASVSDVLEDAENGEGVVADVKQSINEMMSTLPLSGLTTESFDGKNLLEAFNSPEWKDLSSTCLGCGTCTFYCPTCQCYDIREFDTGNGVKRFRCWDSCMYSDFTKMAAENPRHTQLERFRQRFMHKLVYYPMNNNGVYGCVGCGRCLAKCPISMNIVKVMKTVGKEKA